MDGSEHMDDSEKGLKLYELYLEDLGRMGARHETARQFYISVVVAITGFLALAGKDQILTTVASTVGLSAAVAGILVALLWLFHMRSFATLFKVKLKILQGIENPMNFVTKPFVDEGADPCMKKRMRLTTIDTCCSVVVLVLFGALLATHWSSG
jgi:membrane associated rhomboid family serine protease